MLKLYIAYYIYIYYLIALSSLLSSLVVSFVVIVVNYAHFRYELKVVQISKITIYKAMFLCYLFKFLQIPKKGKIYSVNEGNAQNWDEQTAKYVPVMLLQRIILNCK